MSVKFTGKVHSCHDSEIEIPAVAQEGIHKGRVGTMKVPCVMVEVVMDFGGTFTFPVNTDFIEKHAAALREFGFGAEISFEIASTSAGLTPVEVAAAAKALHIANGEIKTVPAPTSVASAE